LHKLERPITLGRDNCCEICVDDVAASRHHARVMPRDDGHYVADLRSTNHTFVNDVRVVLRKLEDGDYLRIGSHIYRYLAGGNIEADYHEEIYRLTITDALTGAYNKRYLLDFLERELTRASRHRRLLSLVLLDIDNFKAVNDTHGHLAGDEVLRSLVDRLRTDIRRDELFARYGGEEFATVLPETAPEGAACLAERMRALIAAEPFHHNDQPLAVTISLGVAFTDGSEALSAEEFIGRADASLYRAKHEGRNRVVA
jgi:diguanylate cyclase (GGDEF)-like protein